MTGSTTSPAADSQPSALSTHTLVPKEPKRQPWRDIWPAPREPQQQAQIYGFAKGETMIFDGNAGNFFAKDGWTVEQESGTPPRKL
jgi:hypothetical protein